MHYKWLKNLTGKRQGIWLFGFSNSVNCREWNATQCAKITLLILSLFKSVWIILIIMIMAWMVVVISYVDNNTIPNENTPTDTFWFNYTFFCTIQTLSFIFLRTCFECNKVKMAYWQFSSLALHLLHTIHTQNTVLVYTSPRKTWEIKRKCKKHITSSWVMFLIVVDVLYTCLVRKTVMHITEEHCIRKRDGMR